MKALQLRFMKIGDENTLACLPGDGRGTIKAFSEFKDGQLVALVDSAHLAALETREAYQGHVNKFKMPTAFAACQCVFDCYGDPDPSSQCRDGQRLAVAIESTNKQGG